MKALREWLHWATNETQLPPEERAARASDLDEFSVIDDAAAYLTQRGFASPDGCATTGEEDIAWCLKHHPQAFRDLCLEFARAIEKMRDLVPEAPQPAEPEDECEDSYEPGPIPWFRYAPMHTGRREGMSADFAREYIGEWVTNTTDVPAAPAVCYVAHERYDVTGFTVIREPSTVIGTHTLEAGHTLEQLAERIREVIRLHGVKRVVLDSDRLTVDTLRHAYGLPVVGATG